MTKFEKYSVKSLANQMFCLPLSLPTGRECTTTKDILVSCSNSFGRSLVALLPRVVVTCWQTREAAPFLVIHTLNEFLTYNANRCQESAAGAKCARRRRTAYETGSIYSRIISGHQQEISAAIPDCGYPADVHRPHPRRMGRQDGFRRMDIRRPASSARIGRSYGQIQQRLPAV